LDYGYLSGRSFPVIDPVCSLKGAIVRTSTRLTHFVRVLERIVVGGVRPSLQPEGNHGLQIDLKGWR